MAKKISKFKYYTKNRISVEGDIKIAMCNGVPQNEFYLELPEYGISLRNSNVEKMISEAEKLLDQKTSINWKDYLMIELEGKTTAELPHYRPMVKILFEISPFKQGENHLGTTYFKRADGGMSEGDLLKQVGFVKETNNHETPTWGFNPDDSFNKIFFFRGDKMKAAVEDTEANQEAIRAIVSDFDKVLQKLLEMFKPENIQLTLAGKAQGLLTGETKGLLSGKVEGE